MKNHYCVDTLCLARTSVKGELCEECAQEKECAYDDADEDETEEDE